MSYQDETPALTQITTITEMLKEAAVHGLEGEVVREAMRLYREMGDADIGQACTDALVEWDL